MNDIAARIPVLSTERLLLRAPTPTDFERHAETLMSPRAQYMGGPYDRQGAWASFAGDVASWVLDGFGYWSVATHEGDRFVGLIGLAKPKHFPEIELGGTVQADAEGQGIACEAASAARDWAFATLKLDSFVSYIDPPNTRSRALAERLGATLDPVAPRPDPEVLVYRHWRSA